MQSPNFYQDDESHWNSSDVGSFAFDFDEGLDLNSSRSVPLAVSSSSVSGNLFQKTELENETPLSALISQRSIFLLIDAENVDTNLSNNTASAEEELKYLRRQLQNRWETPSVKTTLSRMLFNQPVSLELFRSMSSKKELLEGAVNLGDGDTILAIVLYLSSSLKKSLFHQLLKNYPVAVSQYASYLLTKMQIHELSDLYSMLGQDKDAAMKNFQFSCQNPTQQINRLKNCLNNHFSDSPDKYILENFIKLLEWQKTTNSEELFRKSALESLFYACQKHWNDQRSPNRTPLHLMKELNLNERQFQWAMVKGRASVKAWDDIETLLITKTWLGGKKVNTYLSMEEVIEKLHAAGAPTEILLKYFGLINDVNLRIQLATSLQCEQLVIDTLKCHRDQQALIAQKTQTPSPQSKMYSHADNAIRSIANKWWKNDMEKPS